MSTIVDLTGKRFGRLVVLGMEDLRGSKGHKNAVWLCRCDCGGEKIAYSMNLLRGNTTSCGCYSKEVHSKMLKDVWAMWKGVNGNDHVRESSAEAKIGT